MNNLHNLQADEILKKLCLIGEKLNNKTEIDEVKNDFSETERAIEKSNYFTTFGHIFEKFGLSDFEKLVLCHILYCNIELNQKPTISQINEYSGEFKPVKLSIIFEILNNKIDINPQVYDFILSNPPSVPSYLSLDFCPAEKCYHSGDLLTDLYEGFNGLLSNDNAVLNESLAIKISGASESGRKFIIKQLCNKLGTTLLTIDGEMLASEIQINDIIILSKLYNCLLCVDKFSFKNKYLLNDLKKLFSIIFIVTDEVISKTELSGFVLLEYFIPKLTSKERLNIWQNETKGLKFESNIDLSKISNFHNLSVGQIISASKNLIAETALKRHKTVSQELLMSVIKLENKSNILANTQIISDTKSFCDLVLPQEQKKQLADICKFAGCREKLYKVWGFDKKISYGKGISMLFYGASGTGKTMAAQVVANELGLDLYRIDLAQLISKYIGETQKNIGQVFDEAKKCNCVLLFDEADALFSKRSDAGDSQDKYSNAEIAYLLQKTEQYEGITILATNLFQNFDEAFRRRISFLINFPMPDCQLREQLWRNIFPQEAPVSSGISYKFLAENFELSGAAIKNSAVYAGYMAAVNDTEIGMKEIILGIKNEYIKYGKTLNSRQMAEYQNCF